MGAIQNAAGGLAQTALGAAVAGKHLKQQSDSLKEQESQKKLTGINAAVVTQGQLNETNAALQGNMEQMGANKKEILETNKKVKAQQAYKESGKHPNGLYSEKQLQAAETAMTSLLQTRLALQDRQKMILAQRQSLQNKAQAINELYGEKIVEVKPAGVQMADELKKHFVEKRDKSVGGSNHVLGNSPAAEAVKNERDIVRGKTYGK